MLKKYIFEQAVFAAHIENSLKQGKTLSTCVLAVHSFDRGEIFSYLPSNIPEAELLRRFPEGKISMKDTMPTAQYVAAFLEREGRYAIFEDTYAKPSDGALADKCYRFFVYADEVYHFLESGSSPIDITQTMRMSGGYPSIGFLADLSSTDISFSDRQVLQLSQIEIVARKTNHALIGIYDDEATLIWKELL